MLQRAGFGNPATRQASAFFIPWIFPCNRGANFTVIRDDSRVKAAQPRAPV